MDNLTGALGMNYPEIPDSCLFIAHLHALGIVTGSSDKDQILCRAGTDGMLGPYCIVMPSI